MAHEHHHHHHEVANASVGTIYFCLAINLVFVAVEAVSGIWSNSTGLLSDAGHNLSDVLGIVLSLVALYVERSGWQNAQRTSHIVTLVNGLLLLAAVAVIVVESIGKILSPQAVNGEAVIYTAAAGIVINGLTAWLLMRGSENVNIRAAYLHAATDTLVSVGVVLSGIIISFTGFNLIDPLISLAITIIIAVPTVGLIVKTAKLICGGSRALR